MELDELMKLKEKLEAKLDEVKRLIKIEIDKEIKGSKPK